MSGASRRHPFAMRIATDVRLQWRYGLYAISVLMVVFWGVLAIAMDAGTRLAPQIVVVPFVAGNVLITTFFFMAALVLFERGEGVLAALAASPQRPGGYLLSKAVTLTLLATVETLLVVALAFGVRLAWGRLLAGTLILSLFFVFAGLIAVSRFASITQFLLPAVAVVTLLLAPLLAHVGFVPDSWMAPHPVQPMLLLMREAPGAPSAPALAASAAAAAGWCLLAYLAATRALRRLLSRVAIEA